MLAQLLEEYPDDVRIVYRHFPLDSIHDNAMLAAQAAEAAGAQGNFWEMHDLLFESQKEWSTKTEDQFQNWLSDQAQELGLNSEQFESDITSEEIIEKVELARDRGVEIGLPGTPFLLINGQILPDNFPMNLLNLSMVVKLVLLEDQQFTSCPQMTIDDLKTYYATIITKKGEITVELFADVAPIAVNNFIFLAGEDWYDGVTFHRVIPNFVAQAGDPTGTGFGGPGYAFVNEVIPELIFDRAGLIAMANSGPDSNGSQFFITYAPLPDLDGGYTIFGEVISGMEVVENITPRNPSQNPNSPAGDIILDVRIEEK